MSDFKKPLGEMIHGVRDALPDVASEYADFAGAQREAVRPELFVPPFLAILQKGSPQVDEEKPNYIPGARPGMFMNTATGEIYEGKDVGVEILLCWQDYYFIEWTPQDMGGGFHGIYNPDDPIVRRLVNEQAPGSRGRGVFKKLILENGNELVETIQMATLYAPNGEEISADNAQPAFVSCSSTKMTPAKKFIGRAIGLRYGGIQPPQFAHRWKMRTIYEENESGSWYNLRFDLCAQKNQAEALIKRGKPENPAPLFAMAEAFQRAVKGGEAKADYGSAEGNNNLDDNIPF